MSAQVTIQRTFTTTTTSALLVNVGYMKTLPGLLKIFQVETLYHIVATILYVAAGITLLVQLNKHNNRYGRSHYYEEKTAAASIGLVNAALYFLSTLYSVKAFRRG
ncbi:hypothetical protein Avbf_08000 [Armadillidium vulgare]|nr:hypothetical protein Avbf_08000 [Armadillidium vulgare]